MNDNTNIELLNAITQSVTEDDYYAMEAVGRRVEAHPTMSNNEKLAYIRLMQSITDFALRITGGEGNER